MAENNPNRVRLRRQADNRANRIHAARSRVWGFVSKRRSPQRLRHDRRMMTSFLGLPQSTCATTAAAIACRFELADTRIHHRRTAGKDCQIDAWRRWSSYSSTAGLCDQGEGFLAFRPDASGSSRGGRCKPSDPSVTRHSESAVLLGAPASLPASDGPFSSVHSFF
jgi:hypothetical protein